MIKEFLAKCTGFEWDDHNSEKNRVKHGVTPSECEQIFFNRPIIAGDDQRHSKVETRFYVLGQTDSGRMLFLVFTVRNDRIRVISARNMSKKERRIYQKYEEDTIIQ